MDVNDEQLESAHNFGLPVKLEEFFEAEEPIIIKEEAEETNKVDWEAKLKEAKERNQILNEDNPSAPLLESAHNIGIPVKLEECFEAEEPKISKEEAEETTTVDRNQSSNNKVDVEAKLKEAKERSKILNKENPFAAPRYNCIKCGHQTNNTSLFTRHYNKAHLQAEGHISDEYLLQRNSEIRKRCMVGNSFNCDRCHKTYKDYSALMYHYKIHLPPSERFTGLHVNPTKRRYAEIKKVCRIIEDGQVIYKCYHCDKKVRRESQFIKHILRHEYNPIDATIVPFNESFTNTSDNDDEIEVEAKLEEALNKSQIFDENNPSANPTYKCFECGEPSSNSRHLWRHYESVHLNIQDTRFNIFLAKRNSQIKKRCRAGDAYKCDRCKKKYKCWMSMLKHYMKHLPFSERIAYDVTKERSSEILNAGRVTENGLEMYKCDVCRKTIKLKNTFVWHVLRHERNPEDPDKIAAYAARKRCEFTAENGTMMFRCDVCGIVMQYVYMFVTHYMGHIKKGIIRANNPEVERAQKARIKNMCRLMVEEGKIYYKCVACDMKLKEISIVRHYIRHEMRNEVKEDGTFTKAARKKYEERKRSGAIRDRCKVVDATGITAYKCTVCFKQFRTASYIIDHYKKHTKSISSVDDALEKEDDSKKKVRQSIRVKNMLND